MPVVVERALHGERDIVVGREIGEDAGDLERVGDAEPHAQVGRHCGDVVAVEGDGAGRRQQAAGDQADEGGLAGAVRADQRTDLAGQDREVDMVDSLQAAEVAAEPGGCDERRHGSHRSHRSRIAPSMPFLKNSTNRISATPTISR